MSTPRPPPIPEEPTDDRAKRAKTEEGKEAEKDVEMKPKADTDKEGKEDDNSTLGEDKDMVETPNVATSTPGSDAIPTVVHTPPSNKAVENSSAPAEPGLSAPVAAATPAAEAASVLPGAPKTPTAPSLYQQHRQQPTTAAETMPPRSEKKMNLQVSGFTPFKPQPSTADTSGPSPTIAPAPEEEPQQRPQFQDDSPDEPLVQEEEEDGVNAAVNLRERVGLFIAEGRRAAQDQAWIILQDSSERVRSYLHRDPYLDDDGRQVIPSVMDDWTFTFFVLIVLQILLYLIWGSSPMLFETVFDVTNSFAYVPSAPKDLYPRLQELRVELEELHNEEKQSIRLVKKLSNDVQTLLATHEASVTEQLAAYATQTNHRLQLDFDSLWPIEECTTDLASMTQEFLSKIRKLTKTERQKALDKTEPTVRALVRSQLPNDTSSTPGQSPFLTELDTTITERFEQHAADPDRAHIGRGATLIYAKTQPVVPQLGNQLGMALGLLPSYGGAQAALTADNTCWAMRSYGELVVEFPAPLYVDAIGLEQQNPEALVRSFRISGYPEEEGGALSSHPLRLGSFEFKRRHGDTLQLFNIPDRSQQKPMPPLRRIRLQVDSVWEEPFACLHRFRVYGEEESEKEMEMDTDDDEDMGGYYE